MLTVFNDWHIGAIRTAGTTPGSAFRLREDLLDNAKTLLEGTFTDVLFNGDLLDTSNISMLDLLKLHGILTKWLENGHRLFMAAGNHDLSKSSAVLSSFQFLCKILQASHPTQVFPIFSLTEIQAGVWVLPHLPNQDLFDAALAQVPECDILFLHCNYDNNFAAQSDNSLNLSRAQATACKAKQIVLGHEHHGRTMLGGKVLIPGNQMAASVSDCLDREPKQYVVVKDGVASFAPYVPPRFVEIDWRSLEPVDADFIRITGEATPEQGAEVTSAISRFRNAVSAFVVTNAVLMHTDDTAALHIENSLEAMQAFNVLAALKETLTPREVATIESLT